MQWANSPRELCREQRRLALERPELWLEPDAASGVGACFICFARDAPSRGLAGEPAWAAAAVYERGRIIARALLAGQTAAAYAPGLLALREGPLLESVVRALPRAPEVLLVNATGRDHPRRCGLATQLGAVVGLPSVGVTHRPLAARGVWPQARRGARSPLLLDGEVVGCWLRTRAGARPLAVHPGWRTSLETACAVVLSSVWSARAPEPLREARRLARRARAGS